MSKTRWTKTLGTGLLAGLVAALFMTLVMALLRLFVGVPLPAELGGDRFLPLFNVSQFLRILAESGGPLAAKRTALLSGWGGQLAVGVAGGLIYAFIVEWGRKKDPERTWRFGVSRGGALFVAITVLLLWLGSVVVLWPTLGTNNLGLPPVPASFVTALGFLVSYASYGIALILTYRLVTSREPVRSSAPVGQPVGRRAFLAGGAGMALALASGGLVRRVYDTSSLPYDGLGYTGADIKPITPNDEFYVVTKNIIDPHPAKAAWRLRVEGAVDNPHTYNFEEIASMPSIKQETTLECISNAVGGGLISNAVWKGVRLRTLIEEAGPQSGTVDVLLHAADGYTFSITFEKAMEETTLLAYEMNGEPLPQRHGYPARVLVPGYYGEGSAKWVTRLELFDHEVQDRYYHKQGWRAKHVSTMSRFDFERFDPQLPVKPGKKTTLKGVAFGADRGIDRVEVSTDDGQTWNEANIDYSASRLTWALWSFDWSPEDSGEHKLVVRATDGNGDLQVEQGSSINPNGSTGYHKVTARVEA